MPDTLPLLTLPQAAAALAAGGLVAMPTETVYGLAADAQNAQAVAQIFSTKGRPADHPLIVHIAAPEHASVFAQDIPAFAQALMQQFWPGPLTLILPRRPDVAAAAAGGQSSIGLRMPAHPQALALLQTCAERGVLGLAAPSANRFGRVSPTCAAHVADEFGAAVPILDGGDCVVGIESTIVDCSRGAPTILRPGQISAAQIHAALAPLGVQLQDAAAMPSAAPKASGTLEAHYAPRAKVRLMDAASLQTALDVLGAEAASIATYSRAILRSSAPAVIRRHMPQDAAAAAHELFAVLRELDAQGVHLIWVETPPADADWDGVRDRLRRAAAA
ncbi:MAG: L-threonylcarbamoyladenylate synthase [Brachymonas sp.]